MTDKITNGGFILKKACIIILFLILFFCGTAYSQQKMTIAVLDLKPSGVSAADAKATTDIIRSEFVNVANFTVVERGAMDEILKEQGLQMTGCTDASCAVKIGKLLSARKIITGEINAIGKTVMLTLRIIDVEKGTSDYSAREKATSLDAIDDSAVSIARKLAQRIVSGEKEFFSPISPLGYYARSIIPGWGQMYADYPRHAALFAGAFVASGLASYYMYTRYTDKKDAYDSAKPGEGNFSKLRDDYKTSSNQYYYSLGLIGLVYIAHWIDVIFFTAPEFGVKSTAELEKDDGLYFVIQPVVPVNFYHGDRGLSLTAGIRF